MVYNYLKRLNLIGKLDFIGNLIEILFYSLIIATKYDALSILQHLVDYLTLSSHFVIYSQSVQVKTSFIYSKYRKFFLGFTWMLSIFEKTWWKYSCWTSWFMVKRISGEKKILNESSILIRTPFMHLREQSYGSLNT